MESVTTVQTTTTDLASLLSVTDAPGSASVPYRVGGRTLTGDTRAQVATIVADHAMQTRCGASPILGKWRARRDGGPPHEPNHRLAIEAFVGMSFGLPGKEAPPEHLRGHVAELLWHRLTQERRACGDGRELIHHPPLKPDPREPGSDGIVVYRNAADTLVFQLWEVKAHDAVSNSVNATIGVASRQLKARGPEYLAKLVASETAVDGPVADLFKDIVELWFDESDRGGVGVSVGTSTAHVVGGQVSFSALTKAFPHYSAPGQAEGVLVAVPDFPEFANQVRDEVWKGL